MKNHDPAEMRRHRARVRASLSTPVTTESMATRDAAAAMNGILADVFDLHASSKNAHWLDQTKQRIWFLFEASGPGDATTH